MAAPSEREPDSVWETRDRPQQAEGQERSEEAQPPMRQLVKAPSHPHIPKTIWTKSKSPIPTG